jgi:hypothetical protein
MNKLAELSAVVGQRTVPQLGKVSEIIGEGGNISLASDKYFKKGYAGPVSLRLSDKAGAEIVLKASKLISDEILAVRNQAQLQSILGKVATECVVWDTKQSRRNPLTEEIEVSSVPTIGYAESADLRHLGFTLTKETIAEAKAPKKAFSFEDLIGY